MAITSTTIFSGLTAINDLLNNFAAVDTVGIFDASSFEQVFANARPLSAEVRETSTIMKHPVETGTILADNHIINPVEINIPLFISSENYNAVYGQIKQAFVAATSLSVQTRTGVYPNMIIADMPHKEDPDLFDAIAMGLHLVEVLYVLPSSVAPAAQPANFSPENATNTNTVQAGIKFPTATVGLTSQQAIAAFGTGF